MSQAPQGNQLLVFFIVLAILFVIAIILAALGVMRRRRSGRTLSTSTFGNNIDEGRDVGPTGDTSGSSENERSTGGVTKLSGPGCDGRA